MLSRLFFVCVVVFWLVMNGLLLRTQILGEGQLGAAVPVDTVWEKILTAPDNSALDIYDHDKKIGFCHWQANVGLSALAAGKVQSEDYLPEGMVEEPTGYSLQFQGNAAYSATNSVRFDATLMLSTNRQWKDFHGHMNLRPVSWDIHASAAAKKLSLRYDDGAYLWDKSFSFGELQNPEAIVSELGESFDLGVLGYFPLPPQKSSIASMVVDVQWQAHEDRMRFGHSWVRVYRLETHLLGQPIFVFVSRVGEILWIELPNKITFRNEAFSHF